MTEKDTHEGKQLAEMISSLPEGEKMQVIIYVQALEDRAKLSRFYDEKEDMKEVV